VALGIEIIMMDHLDLTIMELIYHVFNLEALVAHNVPTDITILVVAVFLLVISAILGTTSLEPAKLVIWATRFQEPDV
jgi:hypothetical protein